MSLSAKTQKNHSLEESLNNLLPSRYEECYVHLSSNRIVFLTESITKTIASSLTALLINYDKESGRRTRMTSTRRHHPPPLLFWQLERKEKDLLQKMQML